MARLALGILFVALPILEMALLIATGRRIGFWATLSLLIAAGMIGIVILSRQSITAVRKTQEAVARGEPPVAPVLDSMFLVLAGAFLIIPGLLTDVLALLLLIPPVRRWIARWSVRRFAERVDADADAFRETGHSPSRTQSAGGPIIEGEFERVDERTADPRRLEDRK